MQKRAFVVACIIILSILYSVSFAQSPNVTSGLGWLSSSQTPTGNWPQVETSEYYSTATALDAISQIDPASSSYSLGSAWLAGQIVSPTDYLSRRIIALKRAGMDVSSELEGLLLYRNSNGGWGGETSYLSDILDTALALQALKAANYSDTTVLYQAINFLTANQNVDGGWGFYPSTGSGQALSDPSNAYVTAIVLRALSGYSSTFSVQSSIQNASAYLLTKQNTDGGFGSSPSNVYETALSVMSLIESGQGSTPILQNAINYLTTAQSPNGSWNDDPYSTALALQALASARPNLTVSSIAFSKAMPQDGESVTITATINNTGLESASGVIVRFYQGDPLAGGVQIGVDQVIPYLSVSAAAQISITQSFTGTGSRTIFAVADPDGIISETSDADNKASTRVWVATAPDLAVYSEDLKPSTFVPVSGTAFTLNYSVRNLGESATDGFDVALYDGSPAGPPLQTAHISGLAGSVVRIGTLGVTLTGDGSHTLYLVADPTNQASELNEANNTGSVTVQVGGVQRQADLAAGMIQLSPARPTAGQTVQITASVRNQGVEPADNFTVEIFDGAPEAGGSLIHAQTISLAPGAEQTVSANWTIASGIHDVYVVLDRLNVTIESDENNNRASTRVMTDMVDITLSATDLSFTPAHPVSGDSVLFSVTVRNAGIIATGPFNLALYDGPSTCSGQAPEACGKLLQTFSIANIPADGTTTLSYPFTATPWTYRFYAVADTENTVVELYEGNNQAIRSLTIKAPGETYGPDLVPVKIDLSSLTTDSRTLTVSGSANVTFQNKGDDKIATSFNVLVFEDTDFDGRYTAGVDNLLGTGANTLPLWPEGAGMVSVPVSGIVKFLHSPLYALIDSGDAILEQSEDNNFMRTGSDCENRPANPIASDIEVKWRSKSGPASKPVIIANLTDDNRDGQIDEKDIPAILYMTYNSWPSQGRLWAVRGDTGATIFSYFDKDHGPEYESSIAAADIDGDGLSEIFVAGRTYAQECGGLLAISNTGLLKWDNLATAKAWTALSPYNYGLIKPYGSPSIADIDRDGKPEVIVGKTVVNGDGSIKWGPNSGGGEGETNGGLSASLPVDLDLDGKMEVVAGNTAYNSDGSKKWQNNSINDGISVVGNFDGDPYPEIVLMTSTGGPEGSRIYLLDHNGNVVWGPVCIRNLEPISLWTYGSPPVIADFDGDGETEIGIQGPTQYYLVDKNGFLKGRIANPRKWDVSPMAPTVFDLNGDGRPEVITHANDYFRIFDGVSGQLLFEEWFGGSNRTVYQNVRVADVNGDDQAEIIVTGYDSSTDPVGRGDMIRVYGSKSHSWVNSRRIWNQNGYHVTNVNDDGTIPQYESPSWLLNNTYHCQARVGEGSNPYLAPNLTASYFRITQNGADADLTLRIGNGGATNAPEGATVTFYDGEPATGLVISTASTTKILQPGEYQDITYSWPGAAEGLHHINAVVDSGNNIPECREDDNQASVDISVVTGLPDLKIGVEDITLPAAPYYEGSIIPITAGIRNQGSVSVSSVTVRLYNGSPSSGGTQIGSTQTISGISAGGTATLTFNYDTLGRTGMNVLHVIVDQENSVDEANETNNTALLAIDIQPPMLPNLTLSADSVQIAPGSAQEGESMTITAIITNRGASVGNVPVQISVSGQELETKIIYPILSMGGTATVTATLDSTGWAGQQTVYITIDPANTIAESHEGDNTASKPVFIQSAGLATAITLDKAVYQANETVTAAIRIVNAAADPRTLAAGIVINDSAGNLIAVVSSGDVVTLGPDSSVTLAKTWNIGNTLSGAYNFIAEVSEGSLVVSRSSAGLSIAPDKSVQAKATTDKISYNPNETVAITSTVTSISANYIMENLTARITAARGMGQGAREELYSDTKSIATLMPGASFTFKSYWNTSTYAPGTYPVTLEVKDALGAVIATGTQTLTISSTIKPSAVLRGHISVDKQSLLSGETVTVSYSVTNTGNIDLANVALTVQTVHVVSQTVYDTITSQASLTRGSTYTGTGQINTQTYSAKDYLVVLTATIEGVTETLSGTYFRVEGAPTAPSLAAPAMNADVETLTPLLSANNASDPNDDRLTYEFEVYGDSGLASLVAASGRGTWEVGGNGVNTWTVSVTLTENQTYYWRARAYDEKLYGPWMLTASFRVNTVNDPPTAPAPASPSDTASVDTLAPVLTVTNATDPDSVNLTYNFDVALDPGFIQTASSGIGVKSGEGATPAFAGASLTSWQVPVNLQENATYYWRAQADDWLATGPWSAISSFFVNTANDAPTVPVILSPANNAVVTALGMDIVLQNSADPDSAALTYFFEVDTEASFDSLNIIRSGSVPQGPDTTTWSVSGLIDNTQYFARVKASDGETESPWSEASGFFVNTANDAPTTPVPANPSNGAGVNVFTPTLSVHNATDIDRDVLTYEFELYSDEAMTNLVSNAARIAETPQTTNWTVPVALSENQTYFWRARAFDGELTGNWTPVSSFMINTANDAPGSPTLHAPAEGSAVATLLPTLAVRNATDPDSDRLTYDFEIYDAAGKTLIFAITGVPEDSSGITMVTLPSNLPNNTAYTWRARAFDGDRSGPWMSMASFTVHIPVTAIGATVNFDPDTLNKKSSGTWVVVYIELPAGHNPADIDVSSVRLEGTVPAEPRPYAVGDHDKDGVSDLAVKFNRNDVISLLPSGDKVPVHVTGRIGTVTFEGVDIIRVIP